MSPAEREEAARLLAEDEGARRDYAAYQQFKDALREAANQEEVPLERFDKFFAGLAPRPSQRTVWARGLALAAAVVALGFLIPAMWDRTVENDGLTAKAAVRTLETSDPAAAARWVGQKMNRPVPAFKLSGLATLRKAEQGEDWGAYEYDCEGQKVRLVIRQNGYQFKDCGKQKVGKTTFYVGKSIGWKCPSCAYELVGGSESLRWKLARAAVVEQFGAL
jgi:hypothetical protein